MHRMKVKGQTLSLEAKRLRISSTILERETWIVDDFVNRLKVTDYRLDTAKDLGAHVGIDNDAELVVFFCPSRRPRLEA